MKRARAYDAWAHMKQRCLNPNNAKYADYGGRGITICEEFLSYEGFHAIMGDCPDGLTLDRIDNDGNYEPGNVRWTDAITQANNKRRYRPHKKITPKKRGNRWAIAIREVPNGKKTYKSFPTLEEAEEFAEMWFQKMSRNTH